jgi:hypothetical protein
MTIIDFPSIFLVQEQGTGLPPVPGVHPLMIMIQSPSIFTTNGEEMVGLCVAILLNAAHYGDLDIRPLDLQNSRGD